MEYHPLSVMCTILYNITTGSRVQNKHAIRQNEPRFENEQLFICNTHENMNLEGLWEFYHLYCFVVSLEGFKSSLYPLLSELPT